MTTIHHVDYIRTTHGKQSSSYFTIMPLQPGLELGTLWQHAVHNLQKKSIATDIGGSFIQYYSSQGSK